MFEKRFALRPRDVAIRVLREVPCQLCKERWLGGSLARDSRARAGRKAGNRLCTASSGTCECKNLRMSSSGPFRGHGAVASRLPIMYRPLPSGQRPVFSISRTICASLSALSLPKLMPE